MSQYTDELTNSLVSEILKMSKQIDRDKLKCKIDLLLNEYEITKIQPDLCTDIYDKIDLYISAKQLEGLSQLTLDGYKLNLRIFAGIINKNIDDITTTDIRIYLGKHKRLKNSSLSTLLSTLKSFFGWLVEEEIILRDPTRKIKPPKKEKRMVKALTIEELEMLREACITLRERSLVEVLYATGCRLSEIMNMNQQDVNWQEGCAKVIGKGNKERIVYFSYKSMYHLKKYLKERQDTEEALFVTERKPINRMGDRTIQREIENIAKRTEIKKKVHVHTLRHTFATLTLNNGADISTVQSLLGHDNPSTTQVYAQITEQHKKEGYKKYLVQ